MPFFGLPLDMQVVYDCELGDKHAHMLAKIVYRRPLKRMPYIVNARDQVEDNRIMQALSPYVAFDNNAVSILVKRRHLDKE